MRSLEAERCFSISAFSALVAIRAALSSNQQLDAEEIASALKRSDSDYAATDFVAGLYLHKSLPDSIEFGDYQSGLRASLAHLISEVRPWWAHLFPHGRLSIAGALTEDELQTFQSAELLQDPPSETVMKWWDDLALAARAHTADALLLQGREAELLSLEHERKRLEHIGIPLSPRWIAFENNSAGYDIQSFSQGVKEPVNRLIEVKSTTRNPARIILSRGEWEAAVKYGKSYIFHVWLLPQKRLLEFSADDVEPSIPADRGLGSWTHVEIYIPTG